MSIAELESRGTHLSWSKHNDAGEQLHNPARHRWYYCDGFLYECIRPRGCVLWTIYEIGLLRTGGEWVSG